MRRQIVSRPSDRRERTESFHNDKPIQPMHVAFCTNTSYLQHVAVALVSLLEHNAVIMVKAHVILCDVDDQGRMRLRKSLEQYSNVTLIFYSFDGARLMELYTSWHITKEAYIRFFLCELVGHETEKILYLDADVVVMGSLQPLWQMSLGDYAIACVSDVMGDNRKVALGIPDMYTYVNSGVMLMNLRYWRDHRLTAKLMHYVQGMGQRLLWHDQDAINAVLHDRILVLPLRWNFQVTSLSFRGSRRGTEVDLAEERRAAVIIHYNTERKPWMFTMSMPAKHLYRRYLRMTEWRNQPPAGRSMSAVPAFVFNWLMYRLGLPWTSDRFLRSTLPGRALAHLSRACAGSAVSVSARWRKRPMGRSDG